MSLSLLREVSQRSGATLGKGLRVACNLRTYAARRRHAALADNMLTEAARADSTVLKLRGLCPLDITDGDLPELLATCRRLIAERAETAQRTGKGFFAQLLQPADIWANPVLLGAALNPHVLDVLMGTYGQTPFLESIELLVSYPSANQTLSQSQQWHRDRTDSMVVKQVIYIEDVGPQNGPLSVLPPDESRKVPYLSPHYLGDDEIARHVDLSRLAAFSGPAGSRVLVDTGRCFHYGSRVQQRRFALFYYYNTGYAKYPRQGHWRGTQAANMPWNQTQRRVLDLD